MLNGNATCLVGLCSRILEPHPRYSIVLHICISLLLFFVYVNKRICMLKIYGSLKKIPNWDHTYSKKGWDWENVPLFSNSLLINSMTHFTFIISDGHFRSRVNSSNTKRFASLEDLKFVFSVSDTLAELVINHNKSGRPVNTRSEIFIITKLGPLQSEIPQPGLPQPSLLQNHLNQHHLKHCLQWKVC